MCLYRINLNFIRNIVPRCSWQAYGGMYGCLYVWGCLYNPHICTPHTSLYAIHLYVPCMFVCPQTSSICLYGPIHLYAPIHQYAPNTSVHPFMLCMHSHISPNMSVWCHTSVHCLCVPIHLYAPSTSPYMSVCPIHLYTPPYICTSHTSIHV